MVNVSSLWVATHHAWFQYLKNLLVAQLFYLKLGAKLRNLLMTIMGIFVSVKIFELNLMDGKCQYLFVSK